MNLFKYLINFGDNFYEYQPESIWLKILTSFIPVFLGGMISFGIAYYIFNRQNKKKVEDESKRISELKEYIYYCLIELIKSIDKQTELLNESISELNNHVKEESYNGFPVTTKLAIGLNLNQIEKLDVKDTFKILVSDNPYNEANVVNYQFLLACGEQLSLIAETIDLENDESIDTNEKQTDKIFEYGDTIEEIMKDFDEELRNLPSEVEPWRHDYMKNLYKIWWEQESKDEITIEETANLIAGKMLKFIHKEFTENEEPYEIKETRKLSVVCNKIENHYLDIIHTKEAQLETLSNLVVELADIKRNLLNIIELIYFYKRETTE